MSEQNKTDVIMPITCEQTQDFKQIVIEEVSGDLFSDVGRSQKISVIELDSQFTNVLEPNSNIYNQNSSDVEAIVVASGTENSLNLTPTPRIQIYATTPDWQGNSEMFQDLSSAQIAKDMSQVPDQSMTNQSVEISPNKNGLSSKGAGGLSTGCRSKQHPQTDLGKDIFSPSNESDIGIAQCRQDINSSQFQPKSCTSDQSSTEKFQTKISLAPPCLVTGGDDLEGDETLIEEFDASDDDDDSSTRNFCAAQRQILVQKTPLAVNSGELNNA